MNRRMLLGCSVTAVVFFMSLEEIQWVLMTCVLLLRNLQLFIPIISRNIHLEVNCSNSLILLSYLLTKNKEKQGDESHETFMHRNSGKKPEITFSKHCYYLYISLFNMLKLQWWKDIFKTETDKKWTHVRGTSRGTV